MAKSKLSENFTALLLIVKEGINSARTPQGRERVEQFALHTSGYAEPGYDHKDVICVGNFNSITAYKNNKTEELDNTPDLVAAQLEKAGVELQWCDEWAACDTCRKLVRTQSDGPFWKPFYWISGGEVTCGDCIIENPDEYLNALEGDPRSAVTFEIDVEKYGYKLLKDEMENGMYGGQAADPKVVATTLRKLNIDRFLFRINEVTPYQMTFSVYVHESQLDQIPDGWLDDPKKINAELDPAEGLRLSLQAASVKMANLGDARIKVAQCDITTGTATAKAVKPEDFLAGKALDGK